MKWGEFEVVYKKDTGLFNKEHNKNMIKYVEMYPDALNHNIWVDNESKSYFSTALYISTPQCGQNHSFITSPASFFTGKFPGSSHWLKPAYDTLRASFKGLPEVITPEMKCGYNDVIRSIHGQDSVYIVGGGPSTSNIDFSKHKDKPKWVMNSFFKNEKLLNLDNIQLATFLDDVDLNDSRLGEFLSKDPLVVQEISDKGQDRILSIKNKCKNITYMMTRYRSRLGVGARLIVLAILMGVKNIYISGMDGYDVNSELTHSFEKGKAIPRWITNFTAHAPSGTKSAGVVLQRQQFVVFWDYILFNLSKKYDFKIHDLSKGQKTLQYAFIQDSIQ